MSGKWDDAACSEHPGSRQRPVQILDKNQREIVTFLALLCATFNFFFPRSLFRFSGAVAETKEALDCVWEHSSSEATVWRDPMSNIT